jgi:hypothetical protein
MKNIDYMKDPRMSELKDAPLPVQEVYAWRLAVQDAKKGMTPKQIDAYYEASRKETDAFCAKHGLGRIHYVDG